LRNLPQILVEPTANEFIDFCLFNSGFFVVPKPLISPTRRYKLEVKKTYDIINPLSLLSGATQLHPKLGAT